jgi:hypothetical protein
MHYRSLRPLWRDNLDETARQSGGESAAGSKRDDSPLTCGVGKDFFRGIFTQAINLFSTTQRAYSNMILPHWDLSTGETTTRFTWCERWRVQAL